MLEFLFALPFLFFVMILALNFARVSLLRQRTNAALKYAAWADVQRKPLPSNGEISSLFLKGEQANFTVGGSCPVQQVQNTDAGNEATSAMNQGQASTAQISGGFMGLNLGSFFNGLSSSQVYQVSANYHPVFAAGNYWGEGPGTWFPALPVSTCLKMDHKDWRSTDVSLMSVLGNLLGGLLHFNP
jgi:hypothetical protein